MDPAIFERDMKLMEAQLKLYKSERDWYQFLWGNRQTVSLDGKNHSFLAAGDVSAWDRGIRDVRDVFTRETRAVGASSLRPPTSLMPYVAAYKTLIEAKGDPRVQRSAGAKLDAVLNKYASMKSTLAKQLVEDVRAALES